MLPQSPLSFSFYSIFEHIYNIQFLCSASSDSWSIICFLFCSIYPLQPSWMVWLWCPIDRYVSCTIQKVVAQNCTGIICITILQFLSVYFLLFLFTALFFERIFQHRHKMLSMNNQKMTPTALNPQICESRDKTHPYCWDLNIVTLNTQLELLSLPHSRLASHQLLYSL